MAGASNVRHAVGIIESIILVGHTEFCIVNILSVRRILENIIRRTAGLRLERSTVAHVEADIIVGASERRNIHVNKIHYAGSVVEIVEIAVLCADIIESTCSIAAVGLNAAFIESPDGRIAVGVAANVIAVIGIIIVLLKETVSAQNVVKGNSRADAGFTAAAETIRIVAKSRGRTKQRRGINSQTAKICGSSKLLCRRRFFDAEFKFIIHKKTSLLKSLNLLNNQKIEFYNF